MKTVEELREIVDNFEDWHYVSYYGHFSFDFIREFKDEIDREDGWSMLTIDMGIWRDEELLNEFKYYVNWDLVREMKENY